MVSESLSSFALVETSRGVVTAAGVAVFVVLLGVSAFFSSSEIALFSLARHRMESLADQGVPNADRLRRMRRDPHRLLVTILVGNNLANIAMSSIATGLLAFYLSPSVSVLVATFGVTSVVLLFGESAPKSYGVANAEYWALRVTPALELSQRLLYPLVAVFDRLTRMINSATGGQPGIETAYVTRGELEEMIDAGERQGVIEEKEGEIIRQTLEFTSTIAREVMVPWADVTCVDSDASVEEAVRLCVSSGHTRLPVVEPDSDSVVGVVHVLDLVRAARVEDGGVVSDVAGPAFAVPDVKPVDELLAELQKARRTHAVAVDEFGATAGLVTVEDILEELVGEIMTSAEEPPVELVGDGRAVVKGDVSVEAANSALGTEFPTEGDFETVAGLLLSEAGRLLDEGESVVAFGVELEAVEVDDGRIHRVEVELPGDRSG
ncbi:MAG: hemolysin family protein [Halobacteriales archaeon]